MGLTRRGLLHRLAAVGGYGATYSALVSLGMMAAPSAAAKAPDLPADLGRGRRVAILGGGITGLVCAYELERAGFEVVLLEARDRLGGRNWTLRGGDRVEMIGEADQVVGFSPGLYLNAGPARLPAHHHGILDYARKLGVPLEVEINANRSAYIWSETANDGRPVQMRQALNDTRGYLAELLAKSVNKGALDQELTADERALLLPFLKSYGDLEPDFSFRGTVRSGFAQLPGAADRTAAARPPLSRAMLLGHPQIGQAIFEDNIYMQATMFQPLGGMDQIPRAFERHIRSTIIRNAEVTRITRREAEVTIAWRDRASGEARTLRADFALVTIPLALLSRIPANFTPAVAAAIRRVPNDFSNKIGFEAPRFWQQDGIFGGISFVGGETNLVWYPSNDLNAERGVLLAAYGSGALARGFAARPLGEQIAMARSVVGRLHPGHEASLEKPVVVNWSKIPFSEGPWPAWPGHEGGQDGHIDGPDYSLLNRPDGPVYFCGAHLTQMPGWQEGAVLSAHRALELIGRRVAAAGPKAVKSRTAAFPTLQASPQ